LGSDKRLPRPPVPPLSKLDLRNDGRRAPG